MSLVRRPVLLLDLQSRDDYLRNSHVICQCFHWMYMYVCIYTHTYIFKKVWCDTHYMYGCCMESSWQRSFRNRVTDWWVWDHGDMACVMIINQTCLAFGMWIVKLASWLTMSLQGSSKSFLEFSSLLFYFLTFSLLFSQREHLAKYIT